MDEVINVGLIGYGMSGQLFHAPIINSVSGFKLVKVVERHSEKSKERYPWVEVVRDTDEIFNDKNIELVVVAVPNKLHLELAQKALDSGKHVIVEKPFTITSDESQKLIDLAQKQDRILSVYQNRRFDGDFQTVKKVINSNMLGRLVEYEAHYDRYKNILRPSAWKESDELGMGILYDLGSHLIDQAQVLFGLPKSIIADTRVQRDLGRNVDSFEIIMNYDKLKTTLKAGMIVREPSPHYIVHGTSGSFIKYGTDPQEEALQRGLSPVNSMDWGIEPESQWGLLNTNISGIHFKGKIETCRGDYTVYYENIYNAIVKGEELLVKPEEGRNTIRIIELAMQSVKEKRMVEFTL